MATSDCISMLNSSNNVTSKLAHLKIDCIPNWHRSESLAEKLAWMVLFCLTSSACCYLILNTLTQYGKYQVTTTYRTGAETRSTFPMVSLCGSNSLNSDYYVQLLEEANVTSLNSEELDILLQIEKHNKKHTGSYLSNDEKRRLADFDDSIISCTFNQKPCNASHFTFRFFLFDLCCFQFNSGIDANGNRLALHDVAVGGEHNELTMEMYVGIPNKLSSVITRRGVNILISNSTEDPYKNTPSNILVTPGIGMKINVVKNFYSQYNAWPYTYSDCNVNDDGTLIYPIRDRLLFDYTLSTNFTYSQDSCLLFCLQHHLVQRCNCSLYWINYKMPGFDYCFDGYLECANSFYYGVFNVGDFIAKNCLDKCPLECNKQRFDNYQSFYKYPDLTYVQETLQKNAHLIRKYSNQTDFTRKLATNVVQFSIFYDTLTYHQAKEEVRITWDILLSILGGHLHLFLGMSLMSFVEIGELLVRMLAYVKCRGNKFNFFHHTNKYSLPRE